MKTLQDYYIMLCVKDKYCKMYYSIKSYYIFIYFTGFAFIFKFKGKSSLNRDTTSCIRNKNRKRSFIRSTENDNDIYCK